MKKAFVTILACFMLMSLFLPGIATTVADTYVPSRVINLVYDNSGSMSNDGNLAWNQAWYALEVFAAMLGERDTLNLYLISSYENTIDVPPFLTLNGSAGAEHNVSEIHNMQIKQGNTPFNSVRKANLDLSAVQADEKWLVILTDGSFQGVRDDGSKDINDYLSRKDEDIKVMFLGMGPSANVIEEHPEKNIYYLKAENNNDILWRIVDICTRIFDSDRLPINENNEFTIDIPMREIIVFGQGADVQIKGLTNGTNTISSSTSPVEVKYVERFGARVNRNLVGSIASFKGNLNAGSYSIDISGADVIEVYYKPDVEIQAYLKDKDGKNVINGSELFKGTYTIEFGFVKSGTNEKVPESSLLGNVDYQATITSNGKKNEKIIKNGDTITVDGGSLEIDVTARYLKYNTTTSHLSYTVLVEPTPSPTPVPTPTPPPDRNITYSQDNEPLLVVTMSGLEKEEYIEISAIIDGKQFTKEEWDLVGVPDAKVASESNFPLGKFDVAKLDEIGKYRLTPSFRAGGPYADVYKDTVLELSYSEQINGSEWKGTSLVNFKVEDNRTWFERNLQRAIRMIIGGVILFILLGYIPGIKKYLPKSLKKKPYILCKPSEPGEKRKERSGSVEKNLLSTILPYIPQTGTIKYVPKGVTGAPPLAVRAIKGKRMTITNIRALAGKDYITLDGESIKRDCKKFETGASVNIKVKRGEWTYVCSPNQEGH